jgi:hypothetical protein
MVFIGCGMNLNQCCGGVKNYFALLRDYFSR